MNRMKKMAYLFAAVSLLSSCNYDDSQLWDAVNKQEERISILEKWSETVNTNLASLQVLVQCEDFVTSVEPVMKDGQQVGYKINFHSAKSITLYTNSDGQVEGTNTPDIKPVQVENGRWVWQLNGELLKDPVSGNYIYVDACIPQVKVDEQGNVQLSVDGGSTWTTISDANGNVPGNHQVVSVDESTKDKGYITLIISNLLDGQEDTKIQLPVWSDLAKALEEVKADWVLSPKANSVVTVSLDGLKEMKDAAIMVANEAGLTTKVEGNKVTVTMKANNTVETPHFTIMVSDGWNQTIVRNIYPKMQLAAADLSEGCRNGCTSVSVTGDITDKDLATLLNGVKHLDLAEASAKIALQNMASLESVNFVPENGAANENTYDFATWPFKNCTALTEVSFPNGFKAVNHMVKGFENIGATKVVLPEGVKQIGAGSFKVCTSLQYLELPVTITSIGNEFAKGNTTLTTVVFKSESVPTLGTENFSGCAAGLTFYVPDASVGAYEAAWNLSSGTATNKPAVGILVIKPISELSVQ